MCGVLGAARDSAMIGCVWVHVAGDAPSICGCSSVGSRGRLVGLRRPRGVVRTTLSRESAHVRELGPCVDAGLGGDGVHEMHVADEAPSKRGCRNVGSRG